METCNQLVCVYIHGININSQTESMHGTILIVIANLDVVFIMYDLIEAKNCHYRKAETFLMLGCSSCLAMWGRGCSHRQAQFQ